MHAPTSRPPALPPRIASRSPSAHPRATRCSAHGERVGERVALVRAACRRGTSGGRARRRRGGGPAPTRRRGRAATSRADREPRRHRVLVGAVAVDDARRGAVERRVDVAHDVDAAPRCRRAPSPTARSDDVRGRGRRSGVGVCLRSVRSPVRGRRRRPTPASSATAYATRSERRRPTPGWRPSSTSCGSAPKSSTARRPSREQHAHLRLGVAPLVQHEVAGERLGRRDPPPGDVGDQLGPVARRVERRGHHAEVAARRGW